MAKVTMVKARKDYPQFGVAKGDVHYTWALFRQPQQRSMKRPRPSQLQGSPFLSDAYRISEEIEDASFETADDLKDQIDTWCEAIRDLGSECQDSFDQMPEGLQQGDTGVMLEERAAAMEEWADEIEQAKDTADDADLDAALEELQGVGCGV